MMPRMLFFRGINTKIWYRDGIIRAARVTRSVHTKQPTLFLYPRSHARDVQSAKATFPSFSQLLQGQHSEFTDHPEWGSLLDLQKSISEKVASEVLDICIRNNQPRCILHTLVRIDGGVQLSHTQSKEALNIIQTKGDSTDLRQLCRLLQHTEGSLETHTPVLKLDTNDINGTIALCIQRNDVDEAVKWLMTLDTLKLNLAESTCTLILPSLLRKRMWETLFYLLGEMRLSNIPALHHAYDLILQECENEPHNYWRYAPRCLHAILQTSYDGADELLLLRNARRTFSILNQVKEYGAMIDAWDAMIELLVDSPNYQISRMFRDKEIVKLIGSVAINSRNERIVRQLIEGTPAVVAEERSIDSLMLSNIGAAGDLSKPKFGATIGIGIAWLLVTGKGHNALELFSSIDFGNNSASRADALETLSASANISDMADDSLEIFSSIVNEALVALSDNTRRFILSSTIAETFIELFGKTQDAQSTAQVLFHCASQDVNLSESAFAKASQTLLHKGENTLVLQLLETYLSQLDRANNSNNRKYLAHCSDSRIFSPALEALSRLGELDMMMTLLLKEIPLRKCSPTPALYIIAIHACSKAGRFEDGIRLFDLATKSAAKAQLSHGEKEQMHALIKSALMCCANGRMVEKALQILTWIDEKFPQFYSGVQGESRARNLELVVTAMAHPQSISMLPSFIDIIRSGDRPVHFTRTFHVCCLAAALIANDDQVFQSLLAQENDREFHSDRESIIHEAEILAKKLNMR